MKAVFAASIVSFLSSAATASAVECPHGINLLETMSASERDAIFAEGRDTPNGEGRLFRVAGEGVEPSYIFGMVHSTDPRVHDLPDFILDAIAETDTLAIETSQLPGRADEPLIERRPDLFFLPDEQTLSDLLDLDTVTELEGLLANSGMELSDVQQLQPWVVMQTVAQAECEAVRLSAGERIVDALLIELAEAQGSSVISLETEEEQTEAFASQSISDQVAMMQGGLQAAELSGDMLETLIGLYLEGQPGAVLPFTNAVATMGTDDRDADSGESVRYSEWWDQTMIVRNQNMAERLGPILAEGGVFVAIGINHVAGENGVVELVRTQGYDIEPIE